MSTQTTAQPRIGILVVAYNAASTLASVLDRIPDDFRSQISEVLVSDDHSQDSTYLVGLGYQQLSDLPITVIRQPKNLGYGGNQKAGYELAIDHGLDIVVLLHGDGQYAPECLPDIVAPLVSGEADAVFGSRMIVQGAARRGGMPLYKYVGNRILTRFENAILGTHLTEFHSGYRAYSVAALKRLAFHRNSDGFDFDTEIIIQLHDAGMRIAEIPIPTFYGDEICYVNGMRYAVDVCRDVIAYRLDKVGLGSTTPIVGTAVPQSADRPHSSHGRLLANVPSDPPRRLLLLGCGGDLGIRLAERGHQVTGVDRTDLTHVRSSIDRFVQADLNHGIPATVGGNYDIVLVPDVLGQMIEPESHLQEVRSIVHPNSVVLVCVPNVAHWYPRTRSLLGRFGYDRRGILDRSHIRFFTRATVKRMAEQARFRVRRADPVGLPFEAIGIDHPSNWLRLVDRILLDAWPTLFAYQFILELSPRP